MTPDDFRILIQEGEGTKLEFKEALSSSFVWEIVALANTIGGEILLGVRDDGTVIGVHDSNTLRARIHDIARNCDPPVKVRAETEERPMERVAGEVTEEVTGEDRLLRVMSGEMTRQRLQEALGLKHENHFREAYLIPALRSGLIEMTIPDKPPLQQTALPSDGGGKRMPEINRRETVNVKDQRHGNQVGLVRQGQRGISIRIHYEQTCRLHNKERQR